MDYDKLTKEQLIGLLKDSDEYILKQAIKTKELKTEIKELNDDNTWWQNRFNAVERDNRNLQARIDKLQELKENKWDEVEIAYLDDKPIGSGKE